MKKLKIVMLFLFFMVLLEGFILINLSVSYRDKVHIMKIDVRISSNLTPAEKEIKNKELDKRANEIIQSKDWHKKALIIYSVLFALFLFYFVWKMA